MKKLSDKVAVITGGTSGIGLASGRLFVEEGARVVLFARGQQGLSSAQNALGEAAHGVLGDVTRSQDLTRLFQETHAKFGKVNVLFANAAIVKLAPIADGSEAMFDEMVAINMKGAFNTVRLALPFLANGASVIVTTSWLNRMGFAGSSAVAMTKAALRAFVRVAAAELGPRQVRVNALCPGAIETPLWGKLGLPADVLKGAGEAITAQIPSRRWGQPEEIARAALFLACDDSSYVNGSELHVDGGLRQA
jgi:NAD(P)-dependent dehydrogenase (short-subunit alcohol dehydrogenase family)